MELHSDYDKSTVYNFAGDVFCRDLKLKMCMGPPNFLGFWGLMDFKEPLTFKVELFYFRVIGHVNILVLVDMVASNYII